MQTGSVKLESWTCMGDMWSVTTIRQPGEDQEHFCGRHEEAVTALQMLCPPE